MTMNKIIREKRKEIGLTQEQIAEYLGVSTPAVNKWESGATYPDITLLPALARLLKTDLNSLLCFNEGLSEQEISHFCKEVATTIHEGDFERGFTMGIEKIQEYPNCIKLIQSTALLLDGSLIMSGMCTADKEKYSAQITSLYERVAKSDDDQLRNRAVYMLASKYTSHEEYDKAQQMLDLLPEGTALDKTQLQANLWIKQGQLNEAANLLESKLFVMGISEIPIFLTNLAEIAVKEGNYEDASHLAEVSRDTAKLFDLWDYYSYIVPLQVALARENVQESISLLESMLASALTPWEIKNPALYRHIADKVNREGSGKLMLPGLLSELENGSKYAFLRSTPEFHKLLEQYRVKCRE